MYQYRTRRFLIKTHRSKLLDPSVHNIAVADTKCKSVGIIGTGEERWDCFQIESKFLVLYRILLNCKFKFLDIHFYVQMIRILRGWMTIHLIEKENQTPFGSSRFCWFTNRKACFQETFPTNTNGKSVLFKAKINKKVSSDSGSALLAIASGGSSDQIFLDFMHFWGKLNKIISRPGPPPPPSTCENPGSATDGNTRGVHVSPKLHKMTFFQSSEELSHQ